MQISTVIKPQYVIVYDDIVQYCDIVMQLFLEISG